MQDHKARHQQPAGANRVATLAQILLCAALITVGAVFYIWQRYQYIRVGFDVAEQQARLVELERRMEPLEVELDFLSRPDRIDALARQKLGLRTPRPSQIIVVEKDAPHTPEPR